MFGSGKHLRSKFWSRFTLVCHPSSNFYTVIPPFLLRKLKSSNEIIKYDNNLIPTSDTADEGAVLRKPFTKLCCIRKIKLLIPEKLSTKDHKSEMNTFNIYIQFYI